MSKSRYWTNTSNLTRASLAIALTSLLGACSGGGDGGTSSSSNDASGGNSAPSQTVPGTLPTPQYPSGSAQLAAFTLLNQYRTQCGFPVLQQNTVLDQAAQAHAKYMGLNNLVSDTETPGQPGFTGVSYGDRAVAAGFIRTANTAGASGGNTATSSSFSPVASGMQSIYSLVAGVYHSGVVLSPVTVIGIGEYESQQSSSGYTWVNSSQTITLSNLQNLVISNAPLTFPCAGVTAAPYMSSGETPTPPNVSASGWGTPVVVMGNASDAIALQTASITGPAGAVNVQILNASSDPNKEIQPYEAVAYPTSPLQPNTQYSVTLTGTVNGTPFTRSFTFTTGTVTG